MCTTMGIIVHWSWNMFLTFLKLVLAVQIYHHTFHCVSSCANIYRRPETFKYVISLTGTSYSSKAAHECYLPGIFLRRARWLVLLATIVQVLWAILKVWQVSDHFKLSWIWNANRHAPVRGDSTATSCSYISISHFSRTPVSFERLSSNLTAAVPSTSTLQHNVRTKVIPSHFHWRAYRDYIYCTPLAPQA